MIGGGFCDHEVVDVNLNIYKKIAVQKGLCAGCTECGRGLRWYAPSMVSSNFRGISVAVTPLQPAFFCSCLPPCLSACLAACLRPQLSFHFATETQIRTLHGDPRDVRRHRQPSSLSGDRRPPEVSYGMGGVFPRGALHGKQLGVAVIPSAAPRLLGGKRRPGAAYR